MKNFIHNKIKKVFALLAVFPLSLFPVSLLSFQATTVPFERETKSQQERNVKMVLDLSHPQVFVLSEKQVAVKITESNFDKETREAEMAAYKARRETVAREVARKKPTSVAVAPVTTDPGFGQKRLLVKNAAAAYNIPWQILEAVWQVESGKSWDTAKRSSAGATGPMQFLPSTWRKYAVDGDGNGVSEITSAYDAVYGAAKYLASAGAASGQIDRALYAYNHSKAYVAKVKAIAASIQE